jgi:hypothetical protein
VQAVPSAANVTPEQLPVDVHVAVRVQVSPEKQEAP